ncbi:MAG: phage holin family protein [Prevotella sp.]|uniref:phage holin family protein n=1 Tax=Prevotella heparinolytica TaxID=28113 RepID=UPI002A9ABBDF|nr:phage holin family protein [Prevotella sp.]
MFSNDKNVETIAQLIEAIKHYIGLQSEFMKLDVIDKVVKLITGLTTLFIVLFFLLIVLIYLSFAAAHALTAWMSLTGAFLTVSFIYFLILIIFISNRKRWIEKPLVRFLANILLNP